MTQNDTTSIRDQIRVLTIAEGFFDSAVLFALLKLQIFERIGEQGRTLEALAEDIGARADTLARLLNAGVVLGLLETKDSPTYRVAPQVANVLLPTAGERYLGNWIRNLIYFRSALEGLDEATLKSGPMVDPWAPLGSDQDQTREFTLAMHNYAALRGKELAQFLDTSGCETLLDLGCGPGTYAFHLGARNPALRLSLLDLPRVLDVAREVQMRFNLPNEIHYLPLDAVKDEIPGSYDLILVSNTLHMLGERESRKLMRRLYGTVNDGGSLVIQAQFLRDDRLGDRWPVLLDLIQLCITSEGRNHSVAETRAWMKEAGFSDFDYCPMTLLNTNSFIRGYKNSREHVRTPPGSRAYS
jgi:SAM-dependent methyltransferase